MKICGLRCLADVQACAQAGAAMVGFVHCPRSPRHLDLSAIAPLVRQAPMDSVVLLVNPDTALIDQVIATIAPAYIQLHGAESPQLCQYIRARTTGVIKALAIAHRDDLAAAAAYRHCTDYLLIEPKPPANGLPGGNGQTMDWGILHNRQPHQPWMLAGGLSPANVAHALQNASPDFVDVSSGVESRPGVKDAQRIHAFLQAVHDADTTKNP